jgi:activator of 2-hydroxyglutaryl-CoA dehydratase
MRADAPFAMDAVCAVSAGEFLPNYAATFDRDVETSALGIELPALRPPD